MYLGVGVYVLQCLIKLVPVQSVAMHAVCPQKHNTPFWVSSANAVPTKHQEDLFGLFKIFLIYTVVPP